MKMLMRLCKCLVLSFCIGLLVYGSGEAQNTKFWTADVGNYWDYCDGSTWITRNEISQIDTTTFSFPTYLATTYAVMGTDLLPIEQIWFTINEISPDESEYFAWQIRQYDDAIQDYIKFSIDSGALFARRPLIVGDSWVTNTTGLFNDMLPIDITLNHEVLGYESVTVPFGTFNANKIQLAAKISGVGPSPMEFTRYYWNVPYFGDVKRVNEMGELILTESLCGMDIATVFGDVLYDSWAYPYIMNIYDAGLTAGCAAGLYCPEDVVTREQMAVFILKALNDVPADGYCGSTDPFSDVAASRWSCKYIKRLVELGITAGIGQGLFGPEDAVTREQMAVFLTRALDEVPSDGYCGTTSPFTDVPYAYWSCKYVKRLVELGITAGIGQGLYGPVDQVTRAQMAVFLYKAFLAN